MKSPGQIELSSLKTQLLGHMMHSSHRDHGAPFGMPFGTYLEDLRGWVCPITCESP